MRKFTLLLTCLCLYVLATAQQVAEAGSKEIINYLPKEYHADLQNWAITQDERGVLYVGNNSGLLEFDGSSWRLYQVPNKSTIRSLANGEEGKIYAGAVGDLGYFQSNASGQLQFHSLLSFIPKEKRNFSDIWMTYVSGGKVYFGTFDFIFIWDIQKKEFKVIQPENTFHIMFKVGEIIYVREWGKGLEVLKNDSLELVKGGEQFANERVYVMLPFPGEKGTILIGTRTMGLFKYDGSHFTPFKTAADQYLKDNRLSFRSTLLSDGNFFLGTVNGGALVIDTTGRVLARYDLGKGIASNSVEFCFQERLGAVWLATQKGISRIDYSSPVSYFDSRNDMSDICFNLIRHNELIYICTGNGVYELNPTTSKFVLLKNSNTQSWTFLEMGNDLLVGTNDGVFNVEKDRLVPIRKTVENEYNVSVLAASRVTPERIFVATQSGLWSLIKTGSSWKDEGQILKNSDQPSSIVEDKNGNVWMSTQSTGVFRIHFQKDAEGKIILQHPLIEHFDKANGLQEGIVNLSNINGINYFTTADSIYVFNENKKLFYADPSDKIIAEFMKIKGTNAFLNLQQDNLGRVWMGAKDKINMGTLQPDGSWTWVSSPFNRLADHFIFKIYAEKNGMTWFTAGDKIVKYDFGKEKPGSTDYAALVRRVEIGGDSSLYFGGLVDNPVSPKIPFNNNAVSFRYSATSYEGKNVNQFKTILEGFDKEWSAYSTETKRDYTNLPPGSYTFKVAALNIDGIESSIGSYSFEILPAWYQTWWAYILYAAGAFLLIGLIIRYRSQQLRRKNKLLEKKVTQRTKQLSETIDNLKSTQAQLVQSEKMASLGELTAGIAHEIQNPLNFVNNFSELNKEMIDEAYEEMNKGNTEELKNLLDDIKANEEKINHHGKRADAIVKGMLQHSRSSSGHKEPTDINVLCDEYLRLAYHGLRAKDKSFNADFKTDFDESIGKINIMPQDMGRVILNLINNAFYAVNEKAKSQTPNAEGYEPIVTIGTKKENDKVVISVTDNGNGIPEAIKEKIFQPFFTTKPTGSGTGLGLSLSYDIVKAHSGEIKVESEEGKGTTFSIQLPFA